MATRNLTPGGALLRTSRLFSIPAPLSPPPVTVTSSTYFGSTSATLPYPTHLAITASPSSLSRGDWGLKRSLPAVAAKSSTPFVRIRALDTYQHVTEYQSAADHARTLQKWQELNLSLSMPGTPDLRSQKGKSRTALGGSVFEEDLSPGSTRRIPATGDDRRWLFDGPFLARLSNAEFSRYVRKYISKRKDEFNMFLKENKAEEIREAARKVAVAKGDVVPPTSDAEDITDEQLQIYVRSLRQDPSALFKIIGSFLDLPPAPAPSGFIAESIVNFLESIKDDPAKDTPTIRLEDYLPTSKSPYSETGPPITHPSAGLSYLRANRYIYNHPVYGPQQRPPPIEGRVIMPRIPSKKAYIPKIGIAGIVAEAPPVEGFPAPSMAKAKYLPERKPLHPGLHSIEPDVVGGSKIWLHPEGAFINSEGMIDLKLVSGDGPALAIHQGKEYETFDLGKKPVKPIQPHPAPKFTERLRYGLESQAAPSGRQPKINRKDSSDGSEGDVMVLRNIFDSEDKEH